MGPERLVRLPPYNFISSHLSARIQGPEELTIVSQLASVDRHVLRGTWSLGERPNDCSVDFGNSADEVEIAELGQITKLFPSAVHTDVLVLVGKIFIRFSEAGRDESSVEEGLVITTSEVSVESIYNTNYFQPVYVLGQAVVMKKGNPI